MLGECFSEDELDRIRELDLMMMANHQQMSFIDDVTSLVAGSFLGRDLDAYREILSHNRAPDIINHLNLVQSYEYRPIIVDVACGAAVALSQLRPYSLNARLIGFDIRNTPKNILMDRDRNPVERVADLHVRNDVQFFQDIFLNMHTKLPRGCDLLTSVGGFYESSQPDIQHAPPLKYFYDRLRPRGIALIQYNPTEESWQKAKRCLDAKNIPYDFIPAKLQVLDKHALNSKKGLLATLVLGPKV